MSRTRLKDAIPVLERFLANYVVFHACADGRER